MNKIEIILLMIWNIMVIAVYGIDKHKSKLGKWRISEKTLILIAFFMGGFGAFIGMGLFRHKTKHLKFKILIPIAILLNIIVIIGLCYISKYGFDFKKFI